MKPRFVIAPFFTILSLLSFQDCRTQQTVNVRLDEAKKAIAANNELYFKAFVNGDSSMFIKRYTEDCWIMASNAPVLCGKNAPLEYFKTSYNNSGIRNGRLITIDVFGDGVEFVTEIGFWQLFDTDKKIYDSGKYLVLWKKTENGWKVFRDSFSSDR